MTDAAFTVRDTVENRDITVTWHDADHFEHDSVIGHAALDDDWIHLNRDMAPYIGHDNLLHELGHCAGFHHDDVSVMHPGPGYPDLRLDTPVHDRTLTLAERFGGYSVIEWTTRDVLALAREWRHGRTTRSHVEYAANQWRKLRSPPPTVYFADGFDAMGGVYTGALADVFDAGTFYGDPVGAERLVSTREEAGGECRVTKEC